MSNKFALNFEISERKILLRLFDIVIVFIFLKLSNDFFGFIYFNPKNFLWLFVLSFYIQFFGTIFEMYHLQVASKQYLIIKSIILTSIFTFIFFLFTPILSPSLPKQRIEILYFFLLLFFPLFLWRMFYVKIFASKIFNKNVLLIADYTIVKDWIKEINQSDPHYKIIAYFNSKNKFLTDENEINTIKINDLKNVILDNKITEIVIDTQNKNNFNPDIYNILLNFVENGIEVNELSQVYEEITYRIPTLHLSKDFYKFFPFSRNNHNKMYKIYLRIFDVLFSLLFLIIFTVILPFLLLGNLVANRGPLFYTQDRVGKNGKTFKIFKLRSMVQNAEATGAVFAVKNDSRITTFGKFLRKTRIDEIPQIFNILKGEMSVIGPRPERPIFVNQISNKIPFYNTRHFIKPGLTGWAQVNHSYTDNIDDALIKLQFDLYYIKKRNIFLDINILIKTLSTVVYFKGQ